MPSRDFDAKDKNEISKEWDYPPNYLVYLSGHSVGIKQNK